MKTLLLFAALLDASSADLKARLDWLLRAPLAGLPKYETADPPTEATARLGRLLFYDVRLSADGRVSCASCHQVQSVFSNGTALATGIGGAQSRRKAPALVNHAFSGPFFWDGRAPTLEAQATGPLFHPKEMGTNEARLVQTVGGIAGYLPLFRTAFGDDAVTLARITRAIADFERTLLSGDSKWDRWQASPASVAFTPEEQRGYDLFNDRDCTKCHEPPLFTDHLFHNTGVGFANGLFADKGRQEITGKDEETGAFKTPTLRNLTAHAPYMHDGSVATLEAVVDIYDKGGIRNPHLDDKLIPLGLQPAEKTALIAFLKTLDGHGYEDVPPTAEEMPR